MVSRTDTDALWRAMEALAARVQRLEAGSGEVKRLKVRVEKIEGKPVKTVLPDTIVADSV